MHRSGPALLIIAAALCWSLVGPVSRLAYAEGISPLEVAFWRAALATILFGIHARIIGAKLPKRRDAGGILTFAMIGGSLFFLAYHTAVEAGGAALAAVLLYTAPAWVIVAAAFLFKERITALRLLALALTVAGIVLIAMQGGDTRVTTAAIIWGLLAGISYASYYLFGKTYFARYRPEMVYALIFPVTALTLLPFISFEAKSMTAWIAIATVVVMSTYLSFLLYGLGLKGIEAGRASLLATIEPVSASLIAFAWWGERFTASGYIGATLVISAVLLSLRQPKAESATASPRKSA
jgi:drug/metabolite transporter, DME family